VVGLGTVLNVAAIVVGSLIGLALGNRLPERTRAVVTDSLGMLVFVIAAFNIMALTDQAWVDSVGGAATLLIVLGSLIVGGIIGSLLRIESRLELESSGRCCELKVGSSPLAAGSKANSPEVGVQRAGRGSLKDSSTPV